MHSSCNQCRQLYGKGLSSPLDVLQLFHVLIHLSLLQRLRHKKGDNIPGKFLARWIRRNCGIKTAVKRTPDTADYIHRSTAATATDILHHPHGATATAGTDGARCGLYAVHPHRWHRSTAATPVTPNPTGVYIIHPRRVKGLETGRKIRRSRARYKHIALWQIWVRMQRAGANSPHTPLYKCIVYTDRPI